MGVPKFFRYISERYPCLSELAREQSIPEFDNLYLDMNGIIHKCTHPDDGSTDFNISENEMFNDIFTYVDKLFFLIKPQKLFIIAIDGVAPRAKMNQQRSRRFRSAKDAELAEKKAERKGVVRDYDVFDSNCITPGTEFMDRLHNALSFFIKYKISSDPLWQKCRVILSGHCVPGEGEHKIMDYIRYLKSKDDYNPNTRHCLYGLDADLIILGLCTHEFNVVVLREEVKFGRKTKQTSVEETRFFLLHLSLLREYLELDFAELRKYDESFNISKIIDDWVLMGFMVGNDFIPHLPCLHISANALPLLYKTYIKVYPSLGGNINENGKLNLERLEKYFEALSEVEYEIFQENYADLKYFDAKKSKNGIDEAFDFDTEEITNDNVDGDLAELIESSRQFFEDDDEESMDEEQHKAAEFETYKKNYYMEKLNQSEMSNVQKREQAICYITALQWVLDYYYKGLQSWDWYYPHHYAPFISDLKSFKDFLIRFTMGKPFLPFQQLLAVLPPASQKLLPSAYRDLMTNSTSELISYYPNDFETDLNGKKNEWEAVVLLPFIDEKLLLQEMAKCDKNLTPTERKRNTHGPMLQYDYTEKCQDTIHKYKADFGCTGPLKIFCTEKLVYPEDISVSGIPTACIELPNAAKLVYFPGFPTMKHLKFDFELKNANVKVFDYTSRNENIILKPCLRDGFNDVMTVAEKFLNQEVYIGWPHMIRAKVDSVFSKDKCIDVNGTKNNVSGTVFDLQINDVKEHLQQRMGIEIADYSVMVSVRTYVGTTYFYGNQGKIVKNDSWSTKNILYPAQTLVHDIPVHKAEKNITKIEKMFPINSTIFLIGNPYFGSEGVVIDPHLMYSCGRIKVNITVLPEPNLEAAKQLHISSESEYINHYNAVKMIGINGKIISRLTGNLMVIAGSRGKIDNDAPKYNIGLQFRFNKTNEQRAGYARHIQNDWFYSTKALKILQNYCDKFPCILNYFYKNLDRHDCCFESDLFPNSVGENRVEEMVEWVKRQEHSSVNIVPGNSTTIEKGTVDKILEAVKELEMAPVKTVILQVKPHLLLKPDITLPLVYKAKRPINIFDRVVIVKTTYKVPLGAKGTVIGIYSTEDPNPVRIECVGAVQNYYDVLLDKQILNACDSERNTTPHTVNVPECALLLIYNNDNTMNSFDSKMSGIAEKIGNKSGGIQSNLRTAPFESREKVTMSNVSKGDTSNENSKQQQYKQQKQLYNFPPQMQQQKRQPQQPKQLQSPQEHSMNAKGAEDFWMPRAMQQTPKYSEMSQEEMNKRTFMPNFAIPHSQRQQQPELINRSISQNQKDTNASTLALKTVLGVGIDKNQKKDTSSHPIKAPSVLPPPPQNWWRNNSSGNTQQDTLLFEGSSSAMAYGNNKSAPLPPPLGQPFYPVNQPMSKPYVPKRQKEKTAPLDDNQKRAFVPLQWVRGTQSASTIDERCTNTTMKDKMKKLSVEDKTAKHPDANMKLKSTDSNKTTAPTTTAKDHNKKYPHRSSKIGANFDFGNR